MLLLIGAVGAWAETPAEELVRLRKENATLRAEVQKLKEELAAARPAAPKATKYTPESVVKLVPADAMPAGGAITETQIQKGTKILQANLKGEWVRFDMPIRGVVDLGVDTAYGLTSETVAAGAFTVWVDYRFSSAMPPGTDKKVGKTVGVVGKVTAATISNNAGPRIFITLAECQLVK